MKDINPPSLSEYLVKAKAVFLDPKAVSASEMLSGLEETEPFSDSTTLKAITDTLKLHPSIPEDKLCNIGHDVYNDVEFFKCFTDRNTSTVFDHISSCSLQGSKDALRCILASPLYDIDSIRRRQAALQALEAAKPLGMEAVKANEKDVLWVFEDKEQNLKELYEMVFFKFCLLKPLNNYPGAITASNLYRILVSPIVGIMSPLVYIIVPYLIVMYKLKLKIPLKVYLKLMLSTIMSGDVFSMSMMGMGGGGKSSTMFKAFSFVFTIIFYFQGIFNSVEISKTLYKISKHLVGKVNNIVSFLKHAHSINRQQWTVEAREAFLSSPHILSVEEDEKYISTLEAAPFNIAKNFGRQLHIYLSLNKDVIRSVILKTYILEAMQSIVGFRANSRACYTTLLDPASTRSTMTLSESFHPCIDPTRVVKNDIDLSSNAILTGPNAGGKSTFVKSLIINALLAQTVGICVASEATITPFYIINSQINIPDSKGYESLFEAEMYRCKQKLDLLQECNTEGGKHAFFVMDEIFNSTNPVEGIAGAYAIAKKISEHPGCILVFTTHYTYLTKLKKTGRFTNYKMNIERNENGGISYPYKLVPGISRQYIALDLLEQNGFDPEIIKEAVGVKNRLVAPRV